MGLSIVRDVFYRVSDCTKRWHKERRERCGVKCKKKVVGGRRATKVVTKHTHSHSHTHTNSISPTAQKNAQVRTVRYMTSKITFHFFKGMNGMKRRAGQGTLGSSLVEVGKRAILLGLAWTGDIFTFILSFLPVPIQRGGGKDKLPKNDYCTIGFRVVPRERKAMFNTVGVGVQDRTHSQFSSLFFFLSFFLAFFCHARRYTSAKRVAWSNERDKGKSRTRTRKRKNTSPACRANRGSCRIDKMRRV